MGDFHVVLQELITGRTKICKKRAKKPNLSLVLGSLMGSIQKVGLIDISENSFDKYLNLEKFTIELKVLNLLEQIIDNLENNDYWQLARFRRVEIQRNTINNQILQNQIITFCLFE
jgi:hypothetical protein